MPIVRRGTPKDLAEVAAIQEASPEASQWAVTEYLQYDLRVAEESGRVTGFMVARVVAPNEAELLNLAVSPEFRRQGVASHLLRELLEGTQGAIYLEVRQSNTVARKFYKSMGFQEIGVRQTYYNSPPEAAIVMKFHSC